MKSLTIKARSIYTLYRTKRITLDGVKKAVADRIITEVEYKDITGEDYV